MAEERRYRDEEIREIFGLATREEFAALAARSQTDGSTLAEIQDIGREVGIAPAVIAQAAAALETRATRLASRTSLGMPIEVGRTVPLRRALTDSEWEQLVAELRATFGARGRITSHGRLREWANGNLHACIEPSEAGYRLRLGTLKGDAAALNALGATGVVTGAIAFGALLMSGGLQEAVFVPWMITASGMAAFLANLLRLPRWASEREKQMDYIVAKVGALTGGEPTAENGRE